MKNCPSRTFVKAEPLWVGRSLIGARDEKP